MERGLTLDLKNLRSMLDFIANGGNSATSMDALCQTYENHAKQIRNVLDEIIECASKGGYKL